MIAGAALAVIGFTVVLQSDGQITSGPGIEIEFATVGDVSTVYTNSTAPLSECTAEVTGANTIDIQANGLIVGDYCDVVVDVVNKSVDANARFQGFQVNTSALPVGWSLSVNPVGPTLHNYCNTEILKNDGTNDGTGTVGVRIEMMWDAAPNESYDLTQGVDVDGFQFVRDDLYVPGNCQ